MALAINDDHVNIRVTSRCQTLDGGKFDGEFRTFTQPAMHLTVPPICSTACLTMESPRPVPPMARERALSAR